MATARVWRFLASLALALAVIVALASADARAGGAEVSRAAGDGGSGARRALLQDEGEDTDPEFDEAPDEFDDDDGLDMDDEEGGDLVDLGTLAAEAEADVEAAELSDDVAAWEAEGNGEPVLLLTKYTDDPVGDDFEDDFDTSDEDAYDDDEFLQVASTELDRSGFFQGLFVTFLVMLFVEIGDRTFFLAALLASKNDVVATWGGAFGALLTMTVFSALLGAAAPLLMPHWVVHYTSVTLFLGFGAHMLYKAVTMREPDVEAPNPELREVERELDDDKSRSVWERFALPGVPAIFTQAFVLTMLAEWGDRSQFATIALAADYDFWGIVVGGTIGHGIATAIAVIGGRLAASRISEREVSAAAGIIFCFFGVVGLIFDSPDRAPHQELPTILRFTYKLDA